MDIYGIIMKNSKMLEFVPDHLKTKNLRKHAVKKLPYLLEYLPDQYKTQQMCDKATLENSEKCVIKQLIIPSWIIICPQMLNNSKNLR